MMRINYLALLLGILLMAGNISAQSSKEFTINFNSEEQSGTFDMEPDHEAPFTGISAYILQEGVDVDLFYRVKYSEGWSEWQPLQLFTEGATEGRTTFEGAAITKPFESIQFRSDPTLNTDIVFRLYYPASAKKKSQDVTTEQSTEANCSCPQPPVCLRACWCPTGMCPKDTTPDYTRATHLVVHHSASSNTSNDWPAVVSYIWDLHVNTNGWDDIGYNWLIDPDGEIYEGRGDSVQGAHFSCMNTETTGICLLGNFQNTDPQDSAIVSLVEMITWEACDKNMPPSQSSFHNSSQLLLPHVSGHRHGNISTAPNSCAVGTVCPGDSLFALLPMIRDSAASYACLGDVGIDERSIADEAFSVFPNPAGDYINLHIDGAVETGAAIVRIVEPTGKVVLIHHIRINGGSEDIQLAAEGLAPGFYFIQLSLDGQHTVEQFIKR